MYYDYIDEQGDHGGYACTTKQALIDVIQDWLDVRFYDGDIDAGHEEKYFLVLYDENDEEVSREQMTFEPEGDGDSDDNFGKLPQSAFI